MADDTTRQEKTERRNNRLERMTEIHGMDEPTQELLDEFDSCAREVSEINAWFERQKEIDDQRLYGDNPATRATIDRVIERTTLSTDEAEARVLAANRGFAEFCAFGPEGVHALAEEDELVQNAWVNEEWSQRMATALSQLPGRRRQGRGGQQRAQSASDGATGGVIVPTLVRDQIAERMQMFDGVRRVCRVLQSDNLTPFNWPNLDDTDQRGASVSENERTPDADIDDFGEREFRYERLTSGNVRVPETLLFGAQAGIDVAGLVIRLLGQRLGRRGAVLTSHGTGDIKGVVPELRDTAATGEPNSDGERNGRVFRLGAGNNVRPKDVRVLMGFPFEVDAAYRANVSIMGSDQTMLRMFEVLDTEGRSYLIPMLFEAPYEQIGNAGDIQGQRGSTSRLVTNYQMEDWAATKDVLIVGDFMELYTIVDFQGMNVRRYGSENYESGTKGQVIFFADQYCAGNVVDQYAGRLIRASGA